MADAGFFGYVARYDYVSLGNPSSEGCGHVMFTRRSRARPEHEVKTAFAEHAALFPGDSRLSDPGFVLEVV